MNIIADVAGEYKTLVNLLKKMPDEEVIFLGDLVDRGPDSARVIEFVRKHNYRSVLGNHEHLMIDYCRKGSYYGGDVWLWNGGRHTLQSYDPDQIKDRYDVIPEDVLVWMESLPLYLEVDGNLLSHAFIKPDYDLKTACEFGKDIWEVDETRIIWNRREPVKREEYKLQICGHNSQFGLQSWYDDDGNPFAICLDDSRKRVLTGYNLESDTIYQQEYIC